MTHAPERLVSSHSIAFARERVISCPSNAWYRRWRLDAADGATGVSGSPKAGGALAGRSGCVVSLDERIVERSVEVCRADLRRFDRRLGHRDWDQEGADPDDQSEEEQESFHGDGAARGVVKPGGRQTRRSHAKEFLSLNLVHGTKILLVQVGTLSFSHPSFGVPVLFIY